MNNPCVISWLIDFSGVSGAALAITTGLEGALSVTFECVFGWGSLLTPTGNVKIQTSFDGSNWRDVARFDFAQTPFTKHANIEFLLSKGVTSYAALSAEGVYDGVMGSQLRALATWTGNYVGSTLAVRANVR